MGDRYQVRRKMQYRCLQLVSLESRRGMKLPIFQVNAFASAPFAGNPAAVVPLDDWLDDELLQKIASETNLTTAFFVGSDGEYRLRWFTPHTEITGICGHGTLAAALVAIEELNDSSATIELRARDASLGVTRSSPGSYVLDLPALEPESVPGSEAIQAAFDGKAQTVFGALDLFAVLPSVADVISFVPDFEKLLALPRRAAVVTSPGDGDVDFVSRWFCPKQGDGEDTGFTGSAHCSLVPYWAQQLGSKFLRARQPSPRGATVECELKDDRVLLSCSAYKFMAGTICF